MTNSFAAIAIAICAHMNPSAHCHVWHSGDYMPSWYIPSTEILYDKNFRPHIGKSPCLKFTNDAVSWWDHTVLHVRSREGDPFMEDGPACYATVVSSISFGGGSIMLDDQPLSVKPVSFVGDGIVYYECRGSYASMECKR